jgi:transcriptional regulator with XRE-family HTH domain
MSIAAIISRIRAERGWTPSRLAREAGLDPSQVGRIERGERTLTLPSALKLARACGVSMAVFDAADDGAGG